MITYILFGLRIKDYIFYHFYRRGSTDTNGSTKKGESCTDTSAGKKGQTDNDTGTEIENSKLGPIPFIFLVDHAQPNKKKDFAHFC